MLFHKSGNSRFILFLVVGTIALIQTARLASAASPSPSRHKAQAPSTAATPDAPAETPLKAVEVSVVKIFSTSRYPDLNKPWMKQAPSESSGSGVVIEGKRILTNSHVVRYAGRIEVQESAAIAAGNARVCGRD